MRLTTLEGEFLPGPLKFGIVVSRFNKAITRLLLDGALDALRQHGVKDDHVTVAWVPGSLEIPVVARRLAKSKKVDAVICLGCIIRGGTPHFDYVAGETASGIARVSHETEIPVIFGVLTTETVEQAMDRAGLKMGNKGYDAAMAAMETASLLKKI